MQISLSLEIMCGMYDLYRDYATALSSSIQPDDPLYGNFSATQYVTWKAMQSACQWVSNSRLTKLNIIYIILRHE